MVALKMYVCVCKCVHQQNDFQIKAFLSERFQLHLAIYSQCFYSAQEGMRFIIVHGTVENVVRIRFNIKTATAIWI